MQCLFHFYFFKWAILDLFFVYFHLFKQILQFLQQIIVKKCPSNIRCWDSNPQPLKHESPPITTRPTDVTILIRRYINLLIKRIHFKFLTSQVFAARTSFLTFLISVSRLSKELKHFDQTQMCTSCWIRSINSFITIFTLNLPHDDGELLFVSSLLCSESDQLLNRKGKKDFLSNVLVLIFSLPNVTWSQCQCYAEVKNSNELKLDTWLATSNQTTLFQHSVILVA